MPEVKADDHRGNGKAKTEVVGAVMVVGGGIAGMQASLDLAEQGYRVYLVEKKSAVGGHMAQLDKTFPTNDCAMCTISPKLVDTGRHLNIDLLVDSEVLDVQGTAGNFTVTVRRKPRYIKIEDCVACGDCVEVCPVELPDPFNEGLATRKAVYKLYPQGVPNAYAIEKLGVSPCRDACPAGQRAQGYIAMIREGRYQDALRVIKEDNPFPAICGRICNHRCEQACNRGLLDEPVNIRALKRFVTDTVYAQPRQPVPPAERKYHQRVAIIGSGPAGLTAAQDLAKLGYAVTVFEALPVAGGMLRVGVPEYRLPSEIIEREIQDILDLGIELRLNTKVEDLDQLFAQGFHAVLIAVGAHEGVRLPIPGADLPGVLINTDFLRDVRLGNPPPLGKRVLVLGGGNVAIDCARTAVRLGAEVHMACLEARDEMPCHPWEAQAAEEEGVVIHGGRSFLRVVDDGQGHVAGVECIRVKSFSFDEQGRLQLKTIPGTEHVLEADTVIFSVGQRVGLDLIKPQSGVEISPRRTIAVDPQTMAAGRPGVFAAGDSVTGTSFVIDAVAAGHKAAQSIHRYLQGEELATAEPQLPVVKFSAAELQQRVAAGELKPQPRLDLPELPPEKRRASFAEVEAGFSEQQARQEADRCLSCAICSECLSCVYACGKNAIDHNMVERVEKLQVGAIILAPGYEIYQAEHSQEFGLGRYPNVVTALQFERLLSASGPTGGHVRRPSDGQPAKRIAFLQCIGSRDQTHDYCSAVCCMYATKEAVMAKEHDPETEVHVFLMDMRAFSKGYSAYYRRAEEHYGVKYIRCRVSAVHEDPTSGDLILRYVDYDEGPAPGNGRPAVHEQTFDMVVLSVGMEISPAVRELGRKLGVELDSYGFCHTALFDPLQTSRPGIFAAGPFREPKDIPESVVDASGAAAQAAALLAPARNTLARKVTYPPERDVSGEPPRIGVFVCHCGTNIGGYVDVPQVVEHARSLPGVVHAEQNLYTCSQDTVAHITEQVQELGLNRVVVASCTPHTHGPLFQDAIRAAGLNPALFEMANIRNQCSWVHSDDREAATCKAKDLVRMAVARVATLEPLHSEEFAIQPAALVVGGGAAGMTAALTLAQSGYPVHLVEREAELGGKLRHLHRTLDSQDPRAFLQQLESRVRAEPNIHLHLSSKVVETEGFMGNFTTTLEDGQGQRTPVRHAVTVLATGAQEYRGPEYGYGQHPLVVTGLEFEALLASAQGSQAQEPRTEQIRAALGKALPDRMTMLLCVGPAEEYCGRICCATALKNALALKELNPAAEITVLYRDLRTYGFKERLYTTARAAGVRFIRYDGEDPPQVQADEGGLRVQVRDPVLGLPLTLTPEMLLLSMPMVPDQEAGELASRLKVALDENGFFMEAHVKLRPVDFSSDGYFMAGAAHYPKLLDETLVQARAAAARAALILCKPALHSGAVVAYVDPQKCVGCLTCVRVCPFDVPKVRSDFVGVGRIQGAAYIEPSICRGCGNCAAECPAKAIQLLHFKDDQIIVKVDALMQVDWS